MSGQHINRSSDLNGDQMIRRDDEIGNESQYNIDETNESFSERKN